MNAMSDTDETSQPALKQLLVVAHNEFASRRFQESLAAHRLHWGLRYSDPDHLAEGLCGARPFDAVVLDRDNLGQDLQDVCRRVDEVKPEITRFLWSTSEGSSSLTPFLGPHSFLALKDWSASMLDATLRRGLLVSSWLSRPSLRRILGNMKILPVLPEIYRQVVAALDDPEGDLDKVGHLIAQDPVMTAKLLHLANSAFFRRSQPVDHPMEAAMILGAQRLRALVLATQVFMLTEGAADSGLSLETEWRHCLGVANFAGQVARAEGFSNQGAETAFTAGLLHDIGRLLIAANLRETFQAILTKAKESAEAMTDLEARMLGATHADVGALQLAVWGLPLAVVEAAAWHHHPRESRQNQVSILTAVHVANALAHEQSVSDPTDGAQSLDVHYLESLELLDRRNRWREACHVPTRPDEESEAVRREARQVARMH